MASGQRGHGDLGEAASAVHNPAQVVPRAPTHLLGVVPPRVEPVQRLPVGAGQVPVCGGQSEQHLVPGLQLPITRGERLADEAAAVRERVAEPDGLLDRSAGRLGVDHAGPQVVLELSPVGRVIVVAVATALTAIE
jgi:hypothetical protein